jgi:stress response protein YsnF
MTSPIVAGTEEGAMSWLTHLSVGMPVVALDGPLGVITSVPRVDLEDPATPAEVIVLANAETAGPGVEEFLRVTYPMVDRLQNGVLHLGLARRDVPPASASVAATQRLRGTADGLTIPVVEEQIEVQTRVVDLGYVHLRKEVEQQLDERTLQLRHQEVQVEHVPVDQVIPELIEPYMDGDAYMVPIIEEEVVVERRLRLKELLRITRVTAEHEQTLRTPYLSERVVVEEHRTERHTPIAAPEAGEPQS